MVPNRNLLRKRLKPGIEKIPMLKDTEKLTKMLDCQGGESFGENEDRNSNPSFQK
jgi:hypothetical protein